MPLDTLDETSCFRTAPPGFTDEEFETLFRDGVIVLEQKLTPDEIALYTDAIDRSIAAGPEYNPAKTHRLTNIVEHDPEFARLIAHERHVGYAYDFYGEQLRMGQSDLFVRPPGSYVNNWHIDGPRVVPYHVFSANLPLKLRFGYWLTDMPDDNMGNFVYLPGSHLEWGDDGAARTEALASHNKSVPGEKTLTCEAGTITAAFGHVWHRVNENASSVTRKTIFLSYGPSWVNGYHPVDHDWVADLTREERIIMRPYEDDWESYSRPPSEDLPLFLDRSSGTDADPGTNFEAERHKRRRMTAAERYLEDEGLLRAPLT